MNENATMNVYLRRRAHAFFDALTMPTVLAVLMVCVFAGCSQQDESGPRIEPAPSAAWTSPSGTSSSFEAGKAQAQGGRVPAPRTPSVSVSSQRAGQQHLCLDFETGSRRIEYGRDGRIRSTLADGSTQNGLRFDITYRTDAAAFQFDPQSPVRFFEVQKSRGEAAETFSDATTKAPKLRCFRQIFSEFLWADSDLLTLVPKLNGRWACSGPIGEFVINEQGAYQSRTGPGQAFLWRTGSAMYLAMVSKAPGSATRFLGAQEYTIDGLEDSTSSITYRAGGESAGRCTRQP